uniref:Polyprotein n=1 Tax=Steinernema glaseri TaxID=37863 RepID=A0A1I7ZG04_9BILA
MARPPTVVPPDPTVTLMQPHRFLANNRLDNNIRSLLVFSRSTVVGMTKRTTPLLLLSFILVLSFLSSEAIVPAKGKCWGDRIFPFSGTLMGCNATRRCVNESVLLELANKECGQPIEHHTFRESCGIGYYFSIDYTCCAPYKWGQFTYPPYQLFLDDDECLEVPIWRPKDMGWWIHRMKQVVREAKDVHEARREGKHVYAAWLEDRGLLPAIEEYLRISKQLSMSKGYQHAHEFLRCPNITNNKSANRPSDDYYVSRHSALFLLKTEMQRLAYDNRYSYMPLAVVELARTGFNCKNLSHKSVHYGDPIRIAKLSVEIMNLSLELYKNTSLGFDPPSMDIWNSDEGEQLYCEWFVKTVTASQGKGYGYLKGILVLVVLLVAGALIWKYWSVISVTLAKWKSKKNSMEQEKAPVVAYEVFDNEISTRIYLVSMCVDLQHPTQRVHLKTTVNVLLAGTKCQITLSIVVSTTVIVIAAATVIALGYGYLKGILLLVVLLVAGALIWKYWSVISVTLAKRKSKKNSMEQEKAPVVAYEVFDNEISTTSGHLLHQS